MIDRETIGIAFQSAVVGIAPCFLAEAETDEYPFIVYNQNLSSILTKDGLAGLSSYLVASIVSDDADEAEEIAGKVAAAVRTHMTSYGVYPETINRDCTDSVWEIELTWVIRQLTFPPEGSGSGSGDGQSV